MSDATLEKLLEQFPELKGMDLSSMSLETVEDLAKDPDFQRKLDLIVEAARSEAQGRDHVMDAPQGVGMDQIDPNWQAALVERLQFDGDVPEFRIGRLLSEKGHKAAVPVDTDALNPLVVGSALSTASEEVTAEAQRLLEDTESNTRRYLDMLDSGAKGQLSNDLTEAILSSGGDLQLVPRSTLPEVMAVPDPEGYKAGQLPAHRVVSESTATALMALPKRTQQEYAWAVVSTTQGRRSMLNPISRKILERLSGYNVELGVSESDPLLTALWQRRLDEVGVTNVRFNPMTTAISVLSTKIRRELEGLGISEEPLVLNVSPIDSISHRRVGWVAEVYFKDGQGRLEN